MWIWLGSILVLLLLVLTLILLSKITFHIKLKKENKDETILIDVTLLFGLLTYHYRIPALGLNKLQDGLWVENNSSDNFFKTHTSAGEQEIDKEKVNRWADQFRDMIRATRGLKKWMNTTLRRVTLVSMEWSTNFALKDAAHTATLTGALWAVKTTLIGWLSYRVSLQQRPKLFVVPVFGGSPLFSTELNCTAEIRLGNAVYAGMVLVVRVLKVKGGVKKWRSLLSKGNQSGE
ncbi:DUF2953 domain-containing protein [Paenibacillus vini]|uniref:DUF2953 domain-containing protein n=1 Tax=Paenibacillus vini TaxID=1476024 RepID=UPI0025B63E0F|nr:DUF2953 domain-containing protein [Paenibacillus vini]MDN4067445.1 DUF2953 domain-containing protein [Paenibacillus vini]